MTKRPLHSWNFRQFRWPFLGTLICAWMICGPAQAQQGGIEVFAAETLFDQGWRISQSYLYERKGSLYSGSSELIDPLNRLFEEHRAVTGIDYGLFPGLTLSALIPVVYKRQEQSVGGRHATLESSGLGDIAILGKYRFFKADWERSAFHLAIIGGLEMPTGNTSAGDGGIRLPPSLQPGMGSWNPFTGLAGNLDLGRFRFDALGFFKANTEGAQSFARGDFFALEVDAAYRFWLEKYPGPSASAKVGVQWRHKERDEFQGQILPNSGSEVIMIRSGLSFHPIPRMDLSLSVDVPVYRDFSGTQLVRDVRTFIALGIRF